MSFYSLPSSAGTSPSSSSPGSIIYGPYNMSASSSGGNYNVAQRSSFWQDKLDDYCSTTSRPSPTYNISSDRRGKRTAWSCTVDVPNGPKVPALYWYDGQHVNGAKEDAAEQACLLISRERGAVPCKAVGGSNGNGKGRMENWGMR